MEEQLISFETAKLAKELGFSINQFNGYTGDGELRTSQSKNIIYNNDASDFALAPTQSLLQKWLRDKHYLFIEINYRAWSDIPIGGKPIGNEFDFYVEQMDIDHYTHGRSRWHFSQHSTRGKFINSYEQALELALIEALKLIKQ